MVLVLAPMDDVQRVVAVGVTRALAVEVWAALRAQLLAAERNRVWLSPPLLSVAADLLAIVTTSADRPPWSFTVGCLGAGVWLDVGVVESYWHAPFWPEVVNVVELLRRVALDWSDLTGGDLAGRVLELLALPSSGGSRA